jgi:hypothetical protein
MAAKRWYAFAREHITHPGGTPAPWLRTISVRCRFDKLRVEWDDCLFMPYRTLASNKPSDRIRPRPPRARLIEQQAPASVIASRRRGRRRAYNVVFEFRPLASILSVLACFLLLRFGSRQCLCGSGPDVALPRAAHASRHMSDGPQFAVTQSGVFLNGQRRGGQTLSDDQRANVFAELQLLHRSMEQTRANFPGPGEENWVAFFAIDSDTPWLRIRPLIDLSAKAGFSRQGFLAVLDAGLLTDPDRNR